MSDSNEEKILEELKRISRLLALLLIKDQTSQTRQIEMLDRYGFQQKEVANLLGTRPNIVRATLSNIRKKAQTKKVKRQTAAKISKPDDE